MLFLILTESSCIFFLAYFFRNNSSHFWIRKIDNINLFFCRKAEQHFTTVRPVEILKSFGICSSKQAATQVFATDEVIQLHIIYNEVRKLNCPIQKECLAGGCASETLLNGLEVSNFYQYWALLKKRFWFTWNNFI